MPSMEELEGIYEPEKRKSLDGKSRKVSVKIRALVKKFLRESDKLASLEKECKERQKSLLEEMQALAKSCKHLNVTPKSAALGTGAVWFCADCGSRLKWFGQKRRWVFENSEQTLRDLLT